MRAEACKSVDASPAEDAGGYSSMTGRQIGPWADEGKRIPCAGRRLWRLRPGGELFCHSLVTVGRRGWRKALIDQPPRSGVNLSLEKNSGGGTSLPVDESLGFMPPYEASEGRGAH